MMLALASPASAVKYSGEFLYLGAGGRPLALGGAYVAEKGDVLSGYYNPAGLAYLSGQKASFMHSETFGSLLNHDFLAYGRALDPENSRAAMAISLFRLGGGGIIVTARDQYGRIQMVDEESHADYVGYFSYGRRFGRQFSAGLTAKLIYRDIVDESAAGLGFDLGALYSLTSWADIGLNLQDAPGTALSYTTGLKERVNPTARIGTRIYGNRGRFSSGFYADADIRFEGRDYSAQISTGPVSLDAHVGLEVTYMQKLSARIGSDTGNLTLGAGLAFDRFLVDIAMRDHSDLDNTYLVSLTLQF